MLEYPRFVAARRALWDEFEARLGAARKRPRQLQYEDLEQLALQYRRVMHDLALSAARFPGTGAAARLRRLALAGTHWLRHDGGDRRRSVGYFLTCAFPRAFRAHLPHLALAAAMFAATVTFGLVVALLQPAAGATLLGPERIAGLREGHLWTEALSSTVPPAYSSSFIATNNMSVAMLGWAGGALAGLGSLYVVMLNGFVLGAIVAVTMHYQMAPELLEFIAAHGPLEITLILVAAATGLGLGQALVVARDQPRWQLLREEAMRSLLVLIGCLPWFLLLGAVEAFISPSDLHSPAFKITVGLALEAAFLAFALNPKGASRSPAEASAETDHAN